MYGRQHIYVRTIKALGVLNIGFSACRTLSAGRSQVARYCIADAVPTGSVRVVIKAVGARHTGHTYPITASIPRRTACRQHMGAHIISVIHDACCIVGHPFHLLVQAVTH